MAGRTFLIALILILPIQKRPLVAAQEETSVGKLQPWVLKAAGKTPSTLAREVHAKGVSLYRQGDILGAWEAWELAVELDPEFRNPRRCMENTEADHGKALAIIARAQQRLAEDDKWEAKLDMVIGRFESPGPTEIKTVLTNILGVLSGFEFVVQDEVRAKVEVHIQDKTLREILNLLINQNGFVWTRKGGTITVSTKIQSRAFPLTPSEFERVRLAMEHPESIEDPTLDLRRFVYGDRDQEQIPGRELRLDSKNHKLIVRDSAESVARVESWLQQIEDVMLNFDQLVYRSWAFDPEYGPLMYEIARSYLVDEVGGGEKAHQEAGKEVRYDEQNNVLALRDTYRNIEYFEKNLMPVAVGGGGFQQGVYQARLFRVTDNLETDSQSARQRLELTRGVVETLENLLYGGDMERIEDAHARGRRIFYPSTRSEEEKDPRFIGTITVVDTPEDLQRVRDFLEGRLPDQPRRTRYRLYRLDPKVADRFVEDLREEWDKMDETGRRAARDPEQGPMERILAKRRVTSYNDQNQVLTLRGEPVDIAVADELMARQGLTPEIRSGTFETKVFRVTKDTGMDSESVSSRLEKIQQAVADLKAILYETEGVTAEEAWNEGRAIFYPESPVWERDDRDYTGTITVVETKDNLRRVGNYLEQPKRKIWMNARILDLSAATLEQFLPSGESVVLPPERFSEFMTSAGDDDAYRIVQSDVEMVTLDGLGRTVEIYPDPPVECAGPPANAVPPGIHQAGGAPFSAPVRRPRSSVDYLEPTGERSYRLVRLPDAEAPAVILTATPTVASEQVLLNSTVNARFLRDREPLPGAPEIKAGKPVIDRKAFHVSLKTPNKGTVLLLLDTVEESGGAKTATAMTLSISVVPPGTPLLPPVADARRPEPSSPRDSDSTTFLIPPRDTAR